MKDDPSIFDDKDRLTEWADPAGKFQCMTENQWHLKKVAESRGPGRQLRRIIQNAKTHKIALARVKP